MMQLDHVRLKRILLASLVFAAVLTVSAFLFFPAKVAYGVLAGGVIGSFNYFLLLRFGKNVLEERPKPWQVGARFVIRYGLLGLLIALSIFILKVDVIGFAVGISNIPAAISVEAVFPAPQSKSTEGNE